MTATLRVNNNYSFLQTDNQDIKEILWKALRFPDKNYFWNSSYRMKLWDGHKEFFKKDTGRFLTGLLPEIIFTLQHFQIDYQTLDLRTDVQFTTQEITEDFLNPIKLYNYQVDYVNKLIKNKRGVIPSPTGSGKSLTLIAFLKTLHPTTPTLILVNKKQLVEQIYDEAKPYLTTIGRFYDKVKEPSIITCATVQSAKHLLAILPKIKVLVVDEIHEMMSKRSKVIYNKLTNASVRLGMSATAFKFSGLDKIQKYEVKGWIGPLLETEHSESGLLTTKELINRQILSDVKCTFYKINKPNLPYAIYIDAVTKGIAENEYFHELTVELVKSLKGRTLILVERIEHGNRLNTLLPKSLWIQGNDEMALRKEVIEKLKSRRGNLVVIATAGIFNTGVSFFCHNLINAAGGKAEHQIIQRIGRGLRVAKDKKILNYYDFIFAINDYLLKHSMNRIKTLQNQGHQVTVEETI